MSEPTSASPATAVPRVRNGPVDVPVFVIPEPRMAAAPPGGDDTSGRDATDPAVADGSDVQGFRTTRPMHCQDGRRSTSLSLARAPPEQLRPDGGESMKRARLILVRGILALSLAMGLGVPALSAGDSASAATCSGLTCGGKSPQATGCSSDGRTIFEISEAGVRAQLRWSDTCKAYWVRGATPNNTYDWVRIRGYVPANDTFYSDTVRAGYNSWTWTTMVPKGDGVEACVHYAGSSQPPGCRTRNP
ncbi:DUF2690 domain-containing protein [Promicromonospora sp. NPDC050880]|uniref:DUF2690 domain-containing protein n=1 Tax=Promicromonospora sp. NPDC050880 TaxID=3364406 RepID=UPI0037A5869B